MPSLYLPIPNKYGFYMVDAGRVLQNMQLVAWNHGISSVLFTGIREEKMQKDLAIPTGLSHTVIVGLGYPLRIVKGKGRNSVSIKELLSYEKYGNPDS